MNRSNYLLVLVIIAGLPSCTPVKKTGKAIWSVPVNLGKGVARVTSHPVETAKIIWGSSTKALEDARDNAISKTYKCSLNDCFDAVLALARKKRVYRDYREEAEKAEEEKEAEAEDEEDEEAELTPAPAGYFDVFINNRKKGHIVVMGINGNVDTTEAGIFFSQPTLTSVQLDVTSLSSSAKRTVAETVFKELSTQFSAVE